MHMKTLLLIMALVIQGLSTLAATTVTTRVNAVMPLSIPLRSGAVVPTVAIEAKASGARFGTPVYVVVEQISWLYPEKGSGSVIELYVGDSAKQISCGPWELTWQPVTIGPVYLMPDEWRTIVVSAVLGDDVEPWIGENFRLAIVGVVADARSLEQSALPLIYEGSFPVMGNSFTVTNAPAERLSIRNITESSAVISGSGKTPYMLGTFEFVAENGDVEISTLPFTLSLTQGRASSIKGVYLANEKGEEITPSRDVEAYDNETYGFVRYADLHLKVPQGTNVWRLMGSLEVVDIPEVASLFVYSSIDTPVYGLTTSNWILSTFDYTGGSLTIYNPLPWGGSFTRYLTVGVVGGDVKMLQCILNLSPDTQVALSGPGSPGQEGVYFDNETKAALVKFQMKYGLPGTGFLGPLTIALLNSHAEWFTAVRPLIREMSLLSIPGSAKKSLAMQGTIQANMTYRVEVTKDFVSWEKCGSVTKTDTTVLKEVVALVDPVDLGNKAFFRLVQEP